MAPLDLTARPYADWLRVVFDHNLADDELGLDAPPRDSALKFIVSDPLQLIDYVSLLCVEFKPIASACSWTRLDRGIWFLFGEPIRFANFLLREDIALATRARCIHSMYHVFADFVAPSRIPVVESCFSMWWHWMAVALWSKVRWRLHGEEIMTNADNAFEEETENWREVLTVVGELNAIEEARAALEGFDIATGSHVEDPLLAKYLQASYHNLQGDEKQIQQAMFETLQRILQLDDPRCQEYALHGLGQLGHPQACELVQGYLEAHLSNLTPEVAQWAARYRDGALI